MTYPFYLTPSITASDENLVKSAAYRFDNFPDNKVQVAHMGPTWVLSAPGGPHVGPMNLAIRVLMQSVTKWLILSYLILSYHTGTSTHGQGTGISGLDRHGQTLVPASTPAPARTNGGGWSRSAGQIRHRRDVATLVPDHADASLHRYGYRDSYRELGTTARSSTGWEEHWKTDPVSM